MLSELTRITIIIFFGIFIANRSYADEFSGGDLYVSGQAHFSLLQRSYSSSSYFKRKSQQYTVLDADEHKKTLSTSRFIIEKILKQLQSHRNESVNSQVAWVTNQLIDIPYLYANGMGEGDWQPASAVYKSGALHVNQNPVYRLDGLNCQTFVQVAMALLHANTLAQFDKALLKIAYGAAGNPQDEIVRYYNRNNFVDADFNPINQRNGWLTDVTSQGELASYAKKTSAEITRQKWFLNQEHNLAETIQVLSSAAAPAMVNRFTHVYNHLNFPHFDSEHITIHYLPKETLVRRQANGHFSPNQLLLDKIPTPAVVEIVRDVKKWNLYGINIKDIIGTELTISHLGLLYRQMFKRNDLIYKKTACVYENRYVKKCSVTPVLCQKDHCNELMFAHATDAFPMGFYWYKNSDGKYICSPRIPEHGVRYTSCNRVVALPFYDYLADYQLGSYWNMESSSIIGVHIEKLS